MHGFHVVDMFENKEFLHEVTLFSMKTKIINYCIYLKR